MYRSKYDTWLVCSTKYDTKYRIHCKYDTTRPHCGQPLLLTAFMFPIPRRQSCEGRTTPLTTAGAKATLPPPASLTTAQPSLTLASLTLPSTLLFHPCRVRCVPLALMRTLPPRIAARTRSSRRRASTLASRLLPLVRMVRLVRQRTSSLQPPQLTPLAQCTALGCDLPLSSTRTSCLVLPLLVQTHAC